jgi:long-subunit fatty acid transport protein
MRRILSLLCLALTAVALSPHIAAAGGNEFPASGTRNLGRGGSGLTRADDPTLMLRNPALLADMWDDMAYTGINIHIPKSCFQATGGYRWGSTGDDNANFGSGPVLVGAPAGSTKPDGTPLPNIIDTPYPNVCYQGPLPMLPTVALTMKLAPNVGVGLGFFPPDIAALNQWGNREGTQNTDVGWGAQPSPARWFGAHLNTSYFSALGAVGWRPTNWLSIGAGFQWQLVVVSATAFSTTDRSRNTATNNRVDLFGRDLFIPGVVLSAQATPIDNLDIMVGYKWSDRVQSKVKLDVTTGNFGSGVPQQYVESDGTPHSAGSAVPTKTNNLVGSLNAPPIWVPQLSFGVRYADRLTPRVPLDKWNAAHKSAGRTVEDHMATERWDVEANAIVYFNGVNDKTNFTNSGQQVILNGINGMGAPSAPLATFVGQCIGMQSSTCQRESPAFLHGQTQFSIRAGGDYNVLPGLFSVRLGFSYESDGQDVSYLNPENYQLGRTGLHAGATLRVAGHTDISFGYAHFIQKDVALTVNPASPLPNAIAMDPTKYHVVTGKGDGVAKFAIPDPVDNSEGPLFANAGTQYYHLDVVSLSLAQHF